MKLLKVKSLIKSLFVSAILLSAAIFADPIELSLTSEVNSIKPGDSFWVAVDLSMEEGWHAYWTNPGDAGMAPQLDWSLPEGYDIEEVKWPYPQLFTVGPMEGYGYSEQATLLAKIKSPESASLEPAHIKLDLRWVVCNDETCLPGSSESTLKLPVSKDKSEFSNKELFETARTKIPGPLKALEVKKGNGAVEGRIEVKGINADQVKNAHYFPSEGKTAFTLTSHPEELEQLYLTVSEEASKGVVVVGEQSFEVDFSSPNTDVALTDTPLVEGLSSEDRLDSVLMAIALAFIGGLILNLMPCVLPVVALKVLDFVNLSGKDRWHTLKHGLFFALGVLVSFWALAAVLLTLQSLGQSVGWGFQLQEPIFVAALALLMVVFSLSLFGVFEMGTVFASWAGQKEVSTMKPEASNTSYSAFFSGVLATAVATPCTGPFLGSAIGFAVTLPPLSSLAIFTSLGLGMALPYLILTAFPTLLRFVPRPGKWMETFRQAMGFMMLLAALWLTWVFASQTQEPALIMLLLAFFTAGVACWILGKWATPVASKLARNLSWVIVLGLSVVTFEVIQKASSLERHDTFTGEIAENDWIPFSKEKLEALRKEGTPVFLDFTAKWCITCQVNDASLSTDTVAAKMKEKGVVKMKADWTQKDPAITSELKKWGRSSVPLYILYGDESPKILPQTLTPSNVIQSMEDLKTKYVD